MRCHCYILVGINNFESFNINMYKLQYQILFISINICFFSYIFFLSCIILPTVVITVLMFYSVLYYSITVLMFYSLLYYSITVLMFYSVQYYSTDVLLSTVLHYYSTDVLLVEIPRTIM